MSALPAQANLPPMLQQYLEYKRQYPDCLILCQVGDFYEMFFDDARTVSRALNLTLTSRDKNNPDPVPMCGVPVAVVDNYIERLVDQGFSVALISQGETTNGRGAVPRKLERIITPGIRILGAPGAQAKQAVVVAIFPESESELSIAFSDVQSGRVFVRENLVLAQLPAELIRAMASEIVLPGTVNGRTIDRRLGWVKNLEHLVGVTGLKFRNVGLSGATPSARDLPGIPGYSALNTTTRKATRLLVEYIDEVTVGSGLALTTISRQDYDNLVEIDNSARVALELVKSSSGNSSEGSLLGYLDQTQTSAGARTLKQWVLNPLTDLERIKNRLEAVRSFKANSLSRTDLQQALAKTCDLERVATRTELKIVTPKEFGALRETLLEIPRISKVLSEHFCSSKLLSNSSEKLGIPRELLESLESYLVDNPPFTFDQGDIIREGFNSELDRLRQIRIVGKSWIVELEAKERERSGISSLKIKFNNVFGYYIEISNSNLAKVPTEYIRRQTTVGGERFITQELKAREEELLGAEAKQIKLEVQLFEELRLLVKPYVPIIRELALGLAELDALLALAETADRDGLVEPGVDLSTELVIEQGRHPVLAKLLRGGFVPNSISVSHGEPNCFVITGPNMGGKSTYLRQVGLIVTMAQLGSFVPAKSAQIGIVDKIFARIGAADNPLEGESTFMVEMREAAHIVASATERSLLLIDEVGRGTATTDGLSIARAILEWIVTGIKCRTLFATHFYELTELESAYPSLKNLSVGSVDDGAEVIFTHQICPGPASKSYGLEVAKLAGLPEPLLRRAKEIFMAIERGKTELPGKGSPQLSLFSAANTMNTARPVEPVGYKELKEIALRLKRFELLNTTPLQALNLLESIQIDLNKIEP